MHPRPVSPESRHPCPFLRRQLPLVELPVPRPQRKVNAVSVTTGTGSAVIPRANFIHPWFPPTHHGPVRRHKPAVLLSGPFCTICRPLLKCTSAPQTNAFWDLISFLRSPHMCKSITSANKQMPFLL